jgi:hypothetical protein
MIAKMIAKTVLPDAINTNIASIAPLIYGFTSNVDHKQVSAIQFSY